MSGKKQFDMILARLKEMPLLHRKNYKQALSGKSQKSAIKAFCLECVGWQKEEIRKCTSPICPLYLYRPYKIKQKEGSQVCSLDLEDDNLLEGGQ